MPSDAALGAIRRTYEVTLWLVFVASAARMWRARGAAVTSREMAFGLVLSQSVELMAVARGRYRYPDWLVYFPPRPEWVPLGVGLGWAALVPAVMRLSERLLGPRASRWRLAALDGALAVSLDLMLDPIVSNEPLRMWMWRGEGMTAYRYWLLDVPLFNFVGWFLLIGATGLQLRTVEARTDGRRWGPLATFVVLDLAIAAVVMSLPW